MNLWPPFLLTRVRVEKISPTWDYVCVSVPLGVLSRNYNGTMFGGTMFAMTDPFWMVLVHKQLGDGYAIWDKAGEIEYVSPGRTRLRAEFRLDIATIAHIRQRADAGEKVLHWFDTEILDTDGKLIARVRKQVYVRKHLAP